MSHRVSNPPSNENSVKLRPFSMQTNSVSSQMTRATHLTLYANETRDLTFYLAKMWVYFFFLKRINNIQIIELLKIL